MATFDLLRGLEQLYGLVSYFIACSFAKPKKSWICG